MIRNVAIQRPKIVLDRSEPPVVKHPHAPCEWGDTTSCTPAPWSRGELLELCAAGPAGVVDLVLVLWDHVDGLT